MTSTELIMKTIRYEDTPRRPVALLDGYNFFMKQNDMQLPQLWGMPADEAADFIIAQYDKAGSDMVYISAMVHIAVYESLKAALGGQEPPFPAAEDAADWTGEKIWKLAEGHPMLQMLKDLLGALNRKLAGEKPIMAFSVGPFTLMTMLMGMDAALWAIVDEDQDQDALHHLLDVCADLTVCELKYELECGATGISSADPSAAVNLISEENFEKYALPPIRKVFRTFAGMDIPIMLHICGSSSPRVAPLVGSGINIYSMDDVDIAFAQEQAKGDFAIFGNLNTVDVMLRETPEGVARIAKERLAQAKAGLILAPGCDLAPDTPAENVAAMVAAARN